MEVVEPINSKAYQIADECQLGAAQSEYRDDTQIGWWVVTLFLFLGVLFLYIAYLGLQPASSASTGDVPDWLNFLEHSIQALSLILFGTLMLIGGLVSIYLRIKDFVQGAMHVYVCSQGFIIARKRVIEIVRWENIEKIQRRFVYSPPGKNKKAGTLDKLPAASYAIQTKSDTGHAFPEEPGASIEHHMTVYLLPQTIAAYQAEKPLNFGWLTLTAQGIQLDTTPLEELRHSKRSGEWYSIWKRIVAWLERRQALSGTSTKTGELFTPWSKLKMLWIDESKSTLIICRKNEQQHWAIIPLSRVTNVALCMALIQYIQKEKKPGAVVGSRNGAMSDQPASLEIRQVNDAFQLGALVGTYRTCATRPGKIFLGTMLPFLLLIVSIITWLLISLLSTFNDPFFFSPLSLALIIGFSLLFLTLELSVLFFALYTHDALVTPIRRKIFVDLHVDGIVYREGRRQQIISWQQIKFVQRQTTKAWKKLHSFYALHLQNKSTLVLKMIIADVQELGMAVEHAVIKQQFPLLLADYEAGQQIIFPGLCITQQYIYSSSEKLPWDQIGKIEVNQEKLIIKERDTSEDWLSLPISLLPNLCILEELLRYSKQEQKLDTHLML
jgi:hypothetical protein